MLFFVYHIYIYHIPINMQIIIQKKCLVALFCHDWFGVISTLKYPPFVEKGPQ